MTTDIRDLISFKLARLTSLNDRLGQRLFPQEFGITLQEFRTLAIISYLEYASVTSLAMESFRDPGQISRIVSNLIEKGLTERVGANRRGGVLRLTEAGRTLVRQAVPFAADRVNLLLAELSDIERTQL